MEKYTTTNAAKHQQHKKDTRKMSRRMKIFAGRAKKAGFSCNVNSVCNGYIQNVRHLRYPHNPFRRAHIRAADAHRKTRKRMADTPPHMQKKKAHRAVMVLAQSAKNTKRYAKMDRCDNISLAGSHKHQQKTATEWHNGTEPRGRANLEEEENKGSTLSVKEPGQKK